MQKYDYLIVGAGIMGLSVASELKKRFPSAKIAITEKENEVALHASGRNSGILHAGFYYSPDSLKAKLTARGNKMMRDFCLKNQIPVLETGKVVVARNEEESKTIEELARRADKNGVKVEVIDEQKLKAIDPNIKTFKKALLSPSTASVDPVRVCHELKKNLIEAGVDFYFNTPFKKFTHAYDYLICCAGLYADKIAQQFGLAENYTILPFKGRYLKHGGSSQVVSTNVYPVPNLKNPFLGVHFTITAKGDVKIGPTAIPALWRENYSGFTNFNFKEFAMILYYNLKLLILDSFHFRSLALEEVKNYWKRIFVSKAREMVWDLEGDFKPAPTGIRAQLLDKKTNSLVMDFRIEHTPRSTHVLNAVSPAFTCAFSFAEYVVDEVIANGSKAL